MSAFLRVLAPYLAYSFISFVGWTSRLRWTGAEHVRAAGPSHILAFWHQRQAIFTFTHRRQKPPASVLVSRSKDGLIIAEVMRLFGILATRGSSSRGASRAAREMLEILANGRVVGITPDGPKGPSRKVKTGVLYLAQESGRPILPIASAVSRRFELKSAWDRFHFPLPFSRIVVTHGAPIYVRRDDDLKKKAAEVERAMNAATEEADRMAGR